MQTELCACRLSRDGAAVIGFERATAVLARMAALPFADVRTICGPGPVLVLAPHPDDESLGCGGLIAQAVAAGIDVHVAVLTDGSKSHPNSRAYAAPRLAALREEETAAAAAVLGVAPGRLWFLRYPDAAAPRSGARLRAAAAELSRLVQDRGVATVFASWRHDPHCDHLAAHRIVSRARRLARFRHVSYAVWGWTLPPSRWLRRAPLCGARLDIARELPLKRRAIACHRSQYTGLITDDPQGFQLPERLLAVCDRPFETFVEEARPPVNAARRRHGAGRVDGHGVPGVR